MHDYRSNVLITFYNNCVVKWPFMQDYSDYHKTWLDHSKNIDTNYAIIWQTFCPPFKIFFKSEDNSNLVKIGLKA